MNAPTATMAAALVRPALESDMSAIHAIYSHHVLHGFGTFEERPPPLDELDRRRAEVLSRGLPYLVAELAGRIGGYCYAAPFRSRSAYRYSLEDSIYVAPDLGRRGIGRALLEVLVERCSALDYRQMVAVIGDSENWPSIRLHERLGFVRAASLPSIGFKLGRWIDVIMMQRPLGSGATALPS